MPGETTEIRQADALFPSGPWKGYYVYRAETSKHRMDLDLRFADGLVDGSGTDDLGCFTIKGRYDRESLEVRWIKTYAGRHSVTYRGFREGRGIWGTWDLGPGTTGGFMIWPGGLGEAVADAAHTEIEQPDAVSSPGPGAPRIEP